MWNGQQYNPQYQREHYQKHRSQYLARAKRWIHENRERSRELARQRRWQARLTTIQALGGCCQRCGFTDPRALQFDHVRGDGNGEQRYRTNCTIKFLRTVAENKDGKYQLLCANCNWIKRYENNEHGHTVPAGSGTPV